MEKTKLSKNFYITLIIFSLIGQVAWVVENMYFNVFIYKIFKASASDISLMVMASAVSATLTSIFIGALSDKIGKRKLFMVSGYILWGISIFSFALIRQDVISALFGSVVSVSALAISLVIIMDCLMTFFGSSANDAAFNAWLTDSTDETNRGTAEGINSMMPLVAILVVFGGFMAFNLDKVNSWSIIFSVIGIVVILIGVIGLFVIKEPALKKDDVGYFKSVVYSFLPSTIKKNKTLYLSLVAFIIFNISIQIFMPYLIIYYEVSLGIKDYVLIMAPAIIIASLITFLWGKVYDKKGFFYSIIFSLGWLILGYLLLLFFKTTIPVFIGSLFMMSGYLSGMAVFGAKIRDNTEEGKAGRLQGVRIVSQVLLPGIIGPFIGNLILSGKETVLGNDGTYSFIPTSDIFLGALIPILILIPYIILLLRKRKVIINDLKTDLKVDKIPFSLYPRPQFKRDSFINLNGEWDLKVKKGDKTLLDSKVIVPFPVESELSRIKRITKKGEVLEYARTFNLESLNGKTLINFGAVDCISQVIVNDNFVGENKGGYLSFSYDITKFVKLGENKIVVKVIDNLDFNYPYGKQKHKRGGMWYTPISGIWQSVFVEQVPNEYIKDIKLIPIKNSITIKVVGGQNKKSVVLDGKSYHFEGQSITIEISEPKLWSPSSPHLYEFALISGEDKVYSYFALREIKIANGKMYLNDESLFLNGILDQGYYPEGIYLPANEKGFLNDILLCKELGFNAIRKHIKIEPEIFYYYCDKYGIIVMQDMVNNGKYSFILDTVLPTLGLKNKKIGKPTKIQKEIFLDSAKKTIEKLYNHPSVLYYTIFNEGWGQTDGTEIYKTLKKLDDTKIFDTTSGWFFDSESDVQSEHVYFKPIRLTKKEESKPLILSEFGGYSYKINENSYNLTNTYGYKNCTSENFMSEIENLYYNQVVPAIKSGLDGVVLTQISDVEDETNGIITYDRKVVKVDKQVFKKISKTLFEEFKKSQK